MTQSARSISRSLPRWPRGLSRDDSAIYVGVSISKFDEMVSDGRMPKPKKIDKRLVWDILRIDAAFDQLPDMPKVSSWADLREGANENHDSAGPKRRDRA